MATFYGRRAHGEPWVPLGSRLHAGHTIARFFKSANGVSTVAITRSRRCFARRSANGDAKC